MPSSNSLVALLRELTERLHATEGFPPLGTTTTLGSTTTATDDDNLLYADADADALGNAVLRIDETVASGPTSGEFATVRDGGLAPTTGVATVSPAFSAAVQAGTDYSLWKVIHPLTAKNILNRRLALMRREVLIPITMLANGDFEVDTSGWNDIATVTKTRVTTAERVFSGVGALRIQGNAGAPTIRSDVIRAVENQQWLLAAMGMADVGTMTLAAYNETAAGVISGADASSDEEAYVELEAGGGTFSTPSGCEGLRVQVSGTGASDDFYLDDVILWPTDRAWWTCPSFIEDPDHVLSVGYFREGTSAPGSNSRIADEGNWIPWGYKLKPRFVQEGGARPFQLQLDTPVDRPLYARVMRPFAQLSADSDTTTAEKELLLQLTIRDIYRHLEEEAAKRKDRESQSQWQGEAERVSINATVKAFDSRHSEPEMVVTGPQRRSGMRRYRR